MAINPIAFMVVMTWLVLSTLVLLGLLVRTLWRRKIETAALDTILTTLEAMAKTRQQIILNILRPFHPEDEKVLQEQASALVGYETAMQRQVLEAFASKDVSALAALPGWTETLVTPYHALIERLTETASTTAAGGPDIETLRMAFASDLNELKAEFMQTLQAEAGRLGDGIEAQNKHLETVEHDVGKLEARLVTIESRAVPVSPPPEAAEPSAQAAPDTTNEVPVFDNEEPNAAKCEDATWDAQSDLAIEDHVVPPHDGTSTAADDASTEKAIEHDLGPEDGIQLVVDEDETSSASDGEAGDGIEGQDDLAAAWAEALESAGNEDVDIDAIIGAHDDGERQSA